jgi:hypothetical protein
MAWCAMCGTSAAAAALAAASSSSQQQQQQQQQGGQSVSQRVCGLNNVLTWEAVPQQARHSVRGIYLQAEL